MRQQRGVKAIWATGGLLCLAVASIGVHAQDANDAKDAGDCRAIDADAARLACYDRRFGRATGPVPETPLPVSPESAAGGAGPSVSTAAASAGDAASVRTPSALSQFWELEKPDKRGTFRVLTYRPNYLLPFIVSDRVNRNPVTPTHSGDDGLPAYRHLEAMVQVSLRVKLAQELLLPGADLWFGYTHRAQWQVWTGEASRPFRNTDYEPELMYVIPVPASLRALPLGWRWRMSSLGVAHQSNGQTDPLSRSWNRFVLGVGLEKDNFTLEAQVFRRMRERHRDDNPDLTQYIGRGEVRASWLPGRAITTLTWRTNLRDADRGSWQVEWSYPVSADQPQGLRWYVSGFQGYGQSLLDYNFRKVSLGAGVTLINF